MSIVRAVYKPRPQQMAAIAARRDGCKRLITIAHRRFGKDLRFWNCLWLEALKRKGLYNYYFPTFALAKKIVWKGMDNEGRRFIDYIPAELVADKNESDLRIEITNGSMIQLVGTENFNKNLVGINPVGVGFSEYPLCNPMAWELTRPILNANDGWAWFMYTPRGRNHGYRLYQYAKANPSRWFTELLTIKDTTLHDSVTPIVTEEQVQQEIHEGMDPDLAAQEYYCSFEAPTQGSYYGHLMNDLYRVGRVSPTAYNPQLPVITGWDIGVRDSTAIWFAQQQGDDIRLIDYYEAVGKSFEDYFKLVMEKPYTYERMYFPHDLEQRQWGTGKTNKEIITKAFGQRNIGVTIVDKLAIMEGIQVVRRLFRRFRMDSVTIGETKWLGHSAADALLSYHKEYDDEKQVFADRPDHDWSSHCADALRYLCIGIANTRTTSNLFPVYQTSYNPLYDVDTTYVDEENPLYDNQM